MPLKSLRGSVNDATHTELDDAVNKDLEDLVDFVELRSEREYANLLAAIVDRSEDLDKKFINPTEAKSLIKAEDDLRTMLSTAWGRKSYREIRNLAILKKSQPEVQTTASLAAIPLAQHTKNLAKPFGTVYRGAAVDGFYEYLTQNEQLFKAPEEPRYYAKFCSVVQSSGTGKTRMLTELNKKNVIVIYMNLRSGDDLLGFPERDPIPSWILTEFPPTAEEYRHTCSAFFIALFDTLDECLTKTHATRKAKEDLMDWVHQMCDLSHPARSQVRGDFFRKVGERYSKVLAEYHIGSHTSESSGHSSDETAEKLARLAVSEPKADPIPIQDLLSTYEKMTASLENVLADAALDKVSTTSSDRPKLVIAVDEAHPLTPIHPKADYRPADILCRVINQYSHHENHAVWVVFASTTSRVSDFSPPNRRHSSDRVAIRGEKLFQPYTQLGWDQSACRIKDISAENVSRLDHIAGYGRPLWLSLKTAFENPKIVLDAAMAKLCPPYFDGSKPGHVLAVMGQRFALEVSFGHPDSVEHLEIGVESHLRICIATTQDRNWRFTSYPSEPLLSCAAARLLHAPPGKLDQSLGTLLKEVNSGMIDVGQRGELASRLLWLLAKDLFVRTAAKDSVSNTPSKWDQDLGDCQMIPVVDWLEFIFGPRIWHGEDEDEPGPRARKTFENAYLNFSHWVGMEANIAGSRKGKELGLYEWSLRHWHRTSAVQCCHQQPLIDKVIPVYFKGGCEGTKAESRMSQILISDKARVSTSSKDVLHSITRRDKSISSENTNTGSDAESLPYIVILADLGQPPSFSITFPERGSARDCCLRIYAGGVDRATYGFLGEYPTLAKTLKDLVHVQQIPEIESPYREYLIAQMKFGSTATDEHMDWEHGRTVPTISQTFWQS